MGKCELQMYVMEAALFSALSAVSLYCSVTITQLLPIDFPFLTSLSGAPTPPRSGQMFFVWIVEYSAGCMLFVNREFEMMICCLQS